MPFIWSSLNGVQSFLFISKSWLISKLRIFSPQNFSAAGPFKASISGDSDLCSHSSPPLTLSLENGAASQPIRTPARVKKVKGHHRWRENGRAIGHHHNLITKCWKCFFFLRLYTPPRGVKRHLLKMSTDKSLHRIGMWSQMVTIFCHNSTKQKIIKKKKLSKPGIHHF